MHSPKFPHSRKELEKIFAVAKLKSIYKSLKNQITSQTIFDPINFKDFDERLDFECGKIRKKILDATYRPGRPKHFLVEKSRGLCRQMTCIQVVDLIVLEALSRRLDAEIRAAQPVQNAYFMPDDGKFRTSWEKANSPYGSSFGSWKRFQKATFGFANENNFVVVTDVANFYDFIDFRFLRNILAALVKDVSESALDLLLFTLNDLSWRPDFMPPSEVGMPQINVTAPRVLANAMLFELDMVAENMALKNYARFMDDIDVGVESIAQAKNVIKQIDLTLQSRKLRLNASKTKIFSAAQAHSHFCIRENQYLDRLQIALGNPRSKRFEPLLRDILSDRYNEWAGLKFDPMRKGLPDTCRFRTGNGSKLLKWILGIQRNRFKESIHSGDLLWLIRNEPGLRDIAFLTLAVSQSSKTRSFRYLNDLVRQGHFIDDQSFLNFSEYMFQTRYPFSLRIREEIMEMEDAFLQNRNVGTICWLKIACKFATNAELLRCLEREATVDHVDVQTARMMAGCAPRFMHTNEFGKFRDIIIDINSDEAESVLNFLMALASDPTKLKQHKSFLSASNPSLPQGITFQKYLMIMALRRGTHQEVFKQLLAKHTATKLDPFIRANLT